MLTTSNIFRSTLLHSVNAPTLSSNRCLGNGNTTMLTAGASGGGGSGLGAPGAGAAAVLHRRSSPNSSSAYSQSQWRVQKDQGVARCSWKFVAIFFMLLSVILVSALIYTTGRTRCPLPEKCSSLEIHQTFVFLFIANCPHFCVKL